jgi:hypothetical protein
MFIELQEHDELIPAGGYRPSVFIRSAEGNGSAREFCALRKAGSGSDCIVEFVC